MTVRSSDRRRPGLRGYQLDPNALVDLREVQYQWFDYALKGAKRPALLKDRVNYQLMGSNEWRSAPSIEAMGQGALRFYLEENETGDLNRLRANKPETRDVPAADLRPRGSQRRRPRAAVRRS